MAKKDVKLDRVPYRIDTDRNDESNYVVVSINGVKTMIEKGVTVMVKPEVAEVLDHSLEQDAVVDAKLRGLQTRSK